MDIVRLANELEDYIIGQRRYFHRFPEPAWEEVQTTLAIERQLEEMGLEPLRFDDISGVYSYIRGKKAGKNAKTILLRADIDGVSVQEKTGLAFSSENAGMMHACGRDCHIAMLLGAAKLLNNMENSLAGHVKLFFQAAEESAESSQEYIRRGFLQDVDVVCGAHVYGGLEAPYIDISPGYRMASADKFDIEVTGLAAHGSLPHTGKDALVAAAAIISSLQTYVSRNNDPLNPLVITIGTIRGGSQRNIIAGRVKMEGTVRMHSAERRKFIESGMQKIIAGTAEAFGCEAVLSYQYMLPPLYNSPGLSAIAGNAIRKLFGDHIRRDMPPVMASEDFACLTENIPGLYINIGCANKQLGFTENNYSSRFMVDESVLKNGSALTAQIAADYLGGNEWPKD